MKQYLDLLRDIRDNGEEKGDRTGTGTKSDLIDKIRVKNTQFISVK